MRPTVLVVICLFLVAQSVLGTNIVISKSNGLKLNEKKTGRHNRQSLIGIPRRRPQQGGDVIAKLHIPHSSLAKVNVLMLLFYSTLGAAMPFIPLWYRQLGIPDNQVGFLGAITPAVTALVSPLWGALADSTGQHKMIMLLTFVGSIITRCGLMTDGKNVLWLAFVVMVTAVLNAPVTPLMDAAVLSMLEDKSDYGRSRFYGQMGFGLGSWLVGPLLSFNMKYIFVAQALIAIPTAILMTTFKPKPAAPVTQAAPAAAPANHASDSTSSSKDKKKKQKEDLHIGAALRHVATDPKFLVFYFVVFVIGVSSGIIENFAYVRLSEIIDAGNHGGGKGTGHVLGICRIVSSIAGGPMFWLSGKVTKAIGVNGVLTASLTSYVLRFMIYASVQNPWHALPAEALRGSTFAVFWAGCTYYVYNSSPKGLTATMLSLLSGVYAGIGQSTGALIGGSLCKHYGISKSFYIFGAADLVLLVLFGLYQMNLPDGHHHHIPDKPISEEPSEKEPWWARFVSRNHISSSSTSKRSSSSISSTASKSTSSGSSSNSNSGSSGSNGDNGKKNDAGSRSNGKKQ